ncbi:MAG: cytochrome b/b6 domain-containing protein [Rhodobacteraceae bacterium]|nr:cytochrome b/b6 domain-containing protein [Paracoccaceae bacterium]
MRENENSDCGLSKTRSFAVWDPLVRLIHWSLAFAILLNGAILDDDGKWHEYVGYVALGIVGIRLVWGIIGTRYARFWSFPPNPFAALRHFRYMSGNDKVVHLSHNPLGALMAYNIWATVIFLGVTGYMMGTVRFFGFEWVEELHEVAFGWLIVSIVLHVGGVFFDGWRTGVPLVKAMIGGRKKVPADRQIK